MNEVNESNVEINEPSAETASIETATAEPTVEVALAVATPAKRGRGRQADPKSALSQARVLFNSNPGQTVEQFRTAFLAAHPDKNHRVATTYFYIAKKDAGVSNAEADKTSSVSASV